MGVTTTKTNKPFNPRGNDQSPKGYNRAALYSGKALDFDGVNDYINEQSVNVSSTSFSVSFYAKYSDHTTAASCGFSIGATSYDLVVYPFDGASKTFRIYSQYNDNIIIDDSSIPITGVFNHYVVQSDGTNLSVYANGVLASSVAYDNDKTFARFQIGKLIAGTQYYIGQLSNFKLFNTALTAAQVADLYNNPEKVVPTGLESNLKLWLPMMEGAGTTAYDGSGNGNHGTISGATYVNGIGAPVAQSAVIDWNKGVNLLNYSEDFAESSYWTSVQSTITANDTTAPDGQTTADKLLASATTGNHQVDGTFFSIVSGAVTSSVYAKKGNTNFVRLRHNSTTQQIRAWFDLENGVTGVVDNPGTSTIEDAGNGWYKCTMTEAGNTKTGLASLQIFINESDNQTTWTADGDEYIYLWGASFEQSATAGPYVRTGATAQTSEVLLPQGLTTGRDITGVNLFENVRKQGALNLDGNSWAEVHDNESLDFGTGSFTLEAWARAKYVSHGSSLNAIMTLGDSSNATTSASINIINSTGIKPQVYYRGAGTTATTAQNDGDWFHIAGIFDGTNMNIYINGALDNSVTRVASSITNDLVKMIGRDTTTARYYNDQIAQPRIYNRALTAEEVQRNYNAGKNTYTN